MATRPPAESAAFPPSRSRAVLQQHISRTPSRELRGWFRLPRHEESSDRSNSYEFATHTYVPLSHPFVERLIGTLRRACVGSTAVLVCVGPGRQTGSLPELLQCASGPCVVGRADARPDTKGCRTARPLPMGRALPWSLSDADRGVTSDQRRQWRAGRRARVRRLSRHSRAVRQLHALLMPSRQRRGGLPAHGTRRSNDVGFGRIRHPQGYCAPSCATPSEQPMHNPRSGSPSRP